MRTFTCTAVITAFLAVAFLPDSTLADVYRCVAENGHVSYQQFTCDNKGTPIKLKDSRSGWSSLRPGEQALLDSYHRKEAQRRRKPSGLQKQAPKETASCWKKRRQLEALRAKMRRGYSLDESDALHRKRKDYAAYLRQFCPGAG